MKNRFGPPMRSACSKCPDMACATSPTPRSFSGRAQCQVAGGPVFAGMEGTLPVLVEVQALGGRRPRLGTPRRAVVGWDSARLSMILAVLEAHCGVRLGQHDVYLNVGRGYRITEPAVIWRWRQHCFPRLRASRFLRERLLRRGQPVGGGSPGVADAAAPEGSGEAWLFHCVASRFLGRIAQGQALGTRSAAFPISLCKSRFLEEAGEESG